MNNELLLTNSITVLTCDCLRIYTHKKIDGLIVFLVAKLDACITNGDFI